MTTPSSDRRRESLVLAAYDLIASQGFEGLRTRAIADRVGVNVATFHYYFPSKADLIASVAEYLTSQFIHVHAPPVAPRELPSLTRLAQEWEDTWYYRTECPQLLVVMQELSLRSRRDSVVRAILEPLQGHYQGGLERLVREGIQEGAFRADLDPEACGALLASAMAGLVQVKLDRRVYDRICLELERWLR